MQLLQKFKSQLQATRIVMATPTETTKDTPTSATEEDVSARHSGMEEQVKKEKEDKPTGVNSLNW